MSSPGREELQSVVMILDEYHCQEYQDNYDGLEFRDTKIKRQYTVDGTDVEDISYSRAEPTIDDQCSIGWTYNIFFLKTLVTPELNQL